MKRYDLKRADARTPDEKSYRLIMAMTDDECDALCDRLRNQEQRKSIRCKRIVENLTRPSPHHPPENAQLHTGN